jgi:hypothetical protein
MLLNSKAGDEPGAGDLRSDWCIDPQDDAFVVCQVIPTVCLNALEIKAIAGLKQLTFHLVKPNFKLAL